MYTNPYNFMDKVNDDWNNKSGNNCQITHSIIGPNVTIGDDAKVDNAILKDAIIGNFTILEDIVLQHSIIGSDAIVKGRYQSYNIGDNTEIDMVW